MAQLYIDNSVLNKICNNLVFAENFDDQILKDPNLPVRYDPIFTPFSLMEGIGLTVKMTPVSVNHSLSDKIKNAMDKEKELEIIYKYCDFIKEKVFQQFEKDECLLERIKSLQKEKILRINHSIDIEKVKPFIQYDRMNLNKIHDIKQYIALDQVFSHNYREDIKQYIYPFFIRELIGFIISSTNSKERSMSFPFTRAMSKLWEYTINLTRNNNFTDRHKKIITKISSNIKYKNNKDLMDTELVHLAVVGQPNNGNKKSLIYCYTCDDYEKTKDRISLYKGLVRFFLEGLKTEYQTKKIDMAQYVTMGKIIFCDPKDGMFLKVLDIKKVSDVMDDLNLLSKN